MQHDPLLYAYLLDPTYSTYGLRETAFRQFNLKLGPSPAEAADITLRLTGSCATNLRTPGCARSTTKLILPLVPVLARMEEAGVKLDCDVLAEMSRRLEREIETKAREIYDKSGFEFNINSPKQLGDVLFNKLNLPKPIKYGRGKTISTAVDVLEGLAGRARSPAHGAGLPAALQVEVDLRRRAAGAAERLHLRLHTTFNMAGSATGRLSSVNPNLQNIPDSH